MDMFVGQGVVDELAGAPGLDQVRVPEDPELVGDGRLAHAEGFLQPAHREFFSRQEGAEYAHPGQVAHYLQEFARLPDLGRGRTIAG